MKERITHEYLFTEEDCVCRLATNLVSLSIGDTIFLSTHTTNYENQHVYLPCNFILLHINKLKYPFTYYTCTHIHQDYYYHTMKEGETIRIM